MRAPVAKILPVSEVQVRLRGLVSALERQEGDHVMLTRNGRPVAMLINYLEYERLRDMLEALGHSDLAARMRAAGDGRSPAFKRLLAAALATIRPRRR